MKSFIPLLVLIGTLSATADQAEQDSQSILAKILQEEKIELVRNDTDYPVRVTKERIGSLFVCMDTSLKKFDLIKLKLTHFKKGEDAVLLLCHRSGRIQISGDYI